MATNTWAGGASGDTTNWNNSANWSTSGAPTRVPTSADNVIIPNVTHDPTIPDGLNPTVLSIEVQSSAQLTCGNNTITCTNESSDYAFSVSGTLVPNTSTVVISSIGSDTYIKVDNGTLHNLTINSSGDEVKAASNLTIGGDLTITAGELDILTRDLTVTGTTSVSGTLTCNASTVSLGSAKTDGYGLNVASGGTFTGGSGTHTIGSCNLQSSTTFTSGTTTINGVGGGSNYAFWMDTSFTHGGGTIAFTRNGDQLLGESGTDTPTRTFNNLTINKAGGEVKFVEDNAINCVVAGNLKITAGEFDTGADNVALTVTGDVDIATAGTLTTNASAVTVGAISATGNGTYNATTHANGTIINSRHSSLGRGLSMGSVDRLVHNNGKIVFQGASALQGILINGTATSSVGLYDVEINSTAAADCSLMGAVDIYRNLTIIEGELSTHSTQNYALTVDGDCIVGNGSGSANTAILDGNASAISVGSLAIDTDGKYIATSGTTTITSERSDGYAINHDGNFVHSDGTVLITTPATTLLDLLATGNLYNLTINHGSCVARMVAHTTIDNDVTVTAGTLNTAYDVNVTVTGDVSVSGTFGLADESGAHSFGSLTIESGGTHIATSGTTTITKNTGTTLSGSTDRAMAVHGSGTFTHNKGIMKFTASSADIRVLSQSTTNNPFYDVHFTNLGIWASDVNNFIVLNNLTLDDGLQFNGAGGYAVVKGIMFLNGGNFNHAGICNNDNNNINFIDMSGGVLRLTDNSGTPAAIDITVGGIRKTGGSITTA